MRIRKAQPGDEYGIAKVHVDSWRTTYADLIPLALHRSLERRRKAWKRSIEEITAGNIRKAIFVAEDELGEIRGFVDGGPERTNHSNFDSELYAIYLEQATQRRGGGTKLTLELANWLRSQGFSKMLVWVLEANPSRRFYEWMGGELLPERKTYELGEQLYVEVAYGFELARLIEALAVQRIAGK